MKIVLHILWYTLLYYVSITSGAYTVGASGISSSTASACASLLSLGRCRPPSRHSPHSLPTILTSGTWTTLLSRCPLSRLSALVARRRLVLQLSPGLSPCRREATLHLQRLPRRSHVRVVSRPFYHVLWSDALNTRVCSEIPPECKG